MDDSNNSNLYYIADTYTHLFFFKNADGSRIITNHAYATSGVVTRYCARGSLFFITIPTPAPGRLATRGGSPHLTATVVRPPRSPRRATTIILSLEDVHGIHAPLRRTVNLNNGTFIRAFCLAGHKFA